jgi:leucyl/phenylalanyl-tRNA--protein transferase
VVAIGDELSVPMLTEAYRKGIFPWPHDDALIPWFSPRRRAVLFFDDLHVGRSLRREQKRSALRFTIDADFERVIRSCAGIERPEHEGTWILPGIIDAYTDLHRAGVAHSVEVWEGDGLVGGIYGVDAGGVFTGESMFHRRPNASKLALLFLIDHLRERGSSLLDCQVMTPHMESLGAREIPRSQFLDRLAEAQAKNLALF